MRDWQGKKYWLVGASEGLGAALAQVMSRAGVHVILSARSEDKLQALAEQLPGPTTVLPVDVSDDASVAAAAETVGDVDGIVYLAGVYFPQSGLKPPTLVGKTFKRAPKALKTH